MAVIHGVYAIRNAVNGSLYIGSAANVTKRWGAHRNYLIHGSHHSEHLQRAYDKYGRDSFSFEMIEYLDDISLLIEREQLWMDFFKPQYNVCKRAGIPGSKPVSIETRKKRSLALRGRKRPPRSKQWCARLSAAWRPRKLSEEGLARLRATHLGNKYTLGVRPSVETRKKLSLAKMGNKNALGFKYPPESYDSRRRKK